MGASIGAVSVTLVTRGSDNVPVRRDGVESGRRAGCDGVFARKTGKQAAPFTWRVLTEVADLAAAIAHEAAMAALESTIVTLTENDGSTTWTNCLVVSVGVPWRSEVKGATGTYVVRHAIQLQRVGD